MDPTGRADCILLSNKFVDGTSCGYGGRCQQGTCQNGSVLDTAKSWFLSNLSISIPIVIAAGLLALMLLVAILRCLASMIRGGGRAQPVYPGHAVPVKVEDTVAGGLHPMYPPPQAHMHGQSGPAGARNNWVDPTA